MKSTRFALAALALLSVGFAPPALAAADKPLVIESGKFKQLPASTTLQVNGSGTGAASINMPHGTAPASPTNGDCWTTVGGLYCQINGVTVGPYGTGSGGNVATKDEGSTLTSATTSIDWVGGGVTASNVSGAVTVTVPGTGQLIGRQVITATGSGTYTPTSGTNSIIIELQGAGGGGGGVSSPTGSQVGLAEGGGGGAWESVRLTTDFSGASYTVGAKGAGGAAGANTGGNGGSSSFTTTAGSPVTYTAGGGAGGGMLGPTLPTLETAGGAGGAVSGGTPDMSMPGSSGRMGIATQTSRGTTAAGGFSRYSPGAGQTFVDATNMSVAGTSAGGKGGGGSGAMAGGTGAAKAGGDGSDGMIIIWEYR